MAQYENEIYTRAKALYGRESDELQNLCGVAEDELRSELRSGVSGYDEALKKAAAFLALALMFEIEAAAGELSYSAGAVSVRTKPSGAAERLKRQARKIMAPYSADDWFSFLGV